MKKKLSVFCSLLLALAMLAPMAVMPVFAEGDSGNSGDTPATEKYVAPESPAVTYNLNVDWKFIKAGSGQEYPLAKASASVAKDGKQFYEIGYDDSNWLDVSVPHPINAEDSFDDSIGDAGEGGLYRGFMFYRKHVTIPEEDAGKKMFIEFEAARNSVYLYVNGELVGYYEAGIVPVGFDITDYVKPGEDNLIAVATDNASDRGQSDSSKVTHETRPGSTPGAADGYGYQWNTKDFNEVQGGLTGNVNLYVKGKVYQTLPLYNNLKTTGNYIYGSDYNIDSKSAKINVKAEIRNETTAAKNLTLQVDVVGMDGELAYTFEQAGNVAVAEEKVTGMNITAKENIDNAQTIFAVYDGDKLKKVALGDKVTIANGGTKTVSVPNSIISENGTQKIYLWNSIDGMEPFDAEFAEQKGITFEHFMNMVPEDAYAAEPTATDISTVDVSYITASYDASNMRFWSDTDPYLYTVYSILKDGEDVIDVQKTVTGFRKVEYDINDGGLKINDKSTYLKGYAQRATNEWAVVGVANDWLTDIDMQLLKESNGNHIRWMHVAPKPVAVRSSDKYGVLVVCPAGDKEGDVDGRQWDQRVEAMRDAMIYFRNSPSVLFWEAGNNQITPAHMQEMTDLKAALDPNGGRFAGSRTLSSVDQIKAAEYVGTMLNRHASDAKGSMATASKYMPIMETEYARDEAPRRVWDDYSPPDYDYVNKWLGPSGSKTDGYDIWDETSEDFSVANAKAYDEFYSDRVGGSSGNNYYTGAAIMVWSDSNMHTRNAGSENCRTSGKVDPVRIPKDAFYALQAIQSDTPKVHIVGHWNYETKTANNYWYNEKAFNGTYYADTGTKAQRDPSKKTVYVIGSPDIKKVELYINNELVKTNSKPTNTFVYAFTDIDVTQSGEVSVKAYDEMERMVAEDTIQTAGKPDHIKLTPVTGPDGLVADGSDIMYYDVAVVDEDDNVCPVNYDRLDLKVDGEGVLLGGYNSGVGDKITTNKDYCFAECGVNRVFIRSTRNAGQITLTVSHDTLGKQEATISSVAFNNKVGNNEGLSTQLQRSYAANEKPPVVEEKVEPYKTLAQAVKADFDEENGNTKVVEEVDNTDYYTVKVNNKEVTFSERPFRPSGANVVSELKPVLEALKAEGAPIVYSEPTEKPAYVTAGSLPVISITGGIKKDATADNGDTVTQVDVANGYTTLILNQQYAENLMDWQIDVSSSGAVRTELLVPLGYLEGVSAELDAENKVYNITYSAPVTPASFSLSSVEEAPFELAATVDSSQYSIERLNETYSTSTSKDCPDGNGYLKPTAATKVFEGQGETLQSDSLIEFDFRFDDANGTMSIKNGKLDGGKWGPNFSYNGSNFVTATSSTGTQKLGA
ncbi:MAG: hypothetical protein IJH36_05310, partial [Clostridia bacterium]|nr:hypothetical protein [Clostridia bacterium]